jgi:hypothetical protein
VQPHRLDPAFDLGLDIGLSAVTTLGPSKNSAATINENVNPRSWYTVGNKNVSVDHQRRTEEKRALEKLSMAPF